MSDRASGDSKPATLSVMALMVWVAGLAALLGLVEEVFRLARIEGSAGAVGGFLVLYVIYVSLSVRSFWKIPGIAIPTTMLISGIFWTLSLQVLHKLPLFGAAALVVAVPVATALAVGLVFRRMVEQDDPSEESGRPSTVRSLLVRHKGLGPHSTPIETVAEAEN
jgi:hypothetical protein